MFEDGNGSISSLLEYLLLTEAVCFRGAKRFVTLVRRRRDGRGSSSERETSPNDVDRTQLLAAVMQARDCWLICRISITEELSSVSMPRG